MKYQQRAFRGEEPLLKGNLHSHTTRSDGNAAPVEVVGQYKQAGYDFLALTDHNLYNFSHYGVQGITILPGMEIDQNLRGAQGIKTFHTVCIGPTHNNGFDQDEAYAQGGGFFETLDQYQQLLDQVHQKNNLTIYCHPQWSRTFTRDFEDLKGNFALEIWNSGCAIENDCDTDAACWDELLLQGKKIYGVAADDGHGPCHNGVGWVMVNGQNTVESILSALREGAFYSSTGPEIYNFYVQEGQAVLECSPCRYGGFVFGNVPNRLTHAKDHLVEKAVHAIPTKSTYVRGIVKDEKGRMAWTNPIFLDEIE